MKTIIQTKMKTIIQTKTVSHLHDPEVLVMLALLFYLSSKKDKNKINLLLFHETHTYFIGVITRILLNWPSNVNTGKLHKL